MFQYILLCSNIFSYVLIYSLMFPYILLCSNIFSNVLIYSLMFPYILPCFLCSHTFSHVFLCYYIFSHICLRYYILSRVFICYYILSHVLLYSHMLPCIPMFIYAPIYPYILRYSCFRSAILVSSYDSRKHIDSTGNDG